MDGYYLLHRLRILEIDEPFRLRGFSDGSELCILFGKCGEVDIALVVWDLLHDDVLLVRVTIIIIETRASSKRLQVHELLTVHSRESEVIVVN